MSSSHSWTKFCAKFERQFPILTGSFELIYCSKHCKMLSNNRKCRFRDAKFQNLQRGHAAFSRRNPFKSVKIFALLPALPPKWLRYASEDNLSLDGYFFDSQFLLKHQQSKHRTCSVQAL